MTTTTPPPTLLPFQRTGGKREGLSRVEVVDGADQAGLERQQRAGGRRASARPQDSHRRRDGRRQRRAARVCTCRAATTAQAKGKKAS